MSTNLHDDPKPRPERGREPEFLARFRSFLGDRRLRVTRTRLAVIEEVFSSREHFDIEGLYQRLVARGRLVSRATLYRTLDLLVESGLVGRTRLANDTFSYEPRLGQEHHDHMVCESCGRVIESVSAEIERQQHLACEAHGFTPHSHRLVILGHCRECGEASARETDGPSARGGAAAKRGADGDRT